MYKRILLPLLAAVTALFAQSEPAGKSVPPVVHSRIGQKAEASDGGLTVTLADKRQGFARGATYDADIRSPKSVTFSRDGKKFYVNSLEGCKTVVYDSGTLAKLKTIDHSFKSGTGPLWLAPSGFYSFTHYPGGDKRAFQGKPVESALTPDGRYLFVPYYRRTFDINAQDPSALAVIDTKTDEIVLMTETGPLPKMVRVSNDGKLLAITHWGNNTVGFLDISDPDPHKWHHLKPVVIDHQLRLNYSLTSSVDRDSGSGYALRGTLFMPGDSILLVSGMSGRAAVIDVKAGKWLGWMPQLQSVRHISRAGNNVYFSRNTAGEVLSIPTDSLASAISRQRRDSGSPVSFTVNGLRRCKVGGGARTIELSPSGSYLFAACNSASKLYVVNTSTMEVVATAPVDSYPVGLDISPDGSLLVLTSQGRKGHGGNAVNIFKVEYARPEAAPSAAADTVAVDTTAVSAEETAGDEKEKEQPLDMVMWTGGAVVALLALGAVMMKKK